ncbi:MAG: acetylserotonin O-methyltransferase [Chloroflexota bacterium]|nr:acetylserotonin O-methyltransferase [Chloroflexota bacterium]
MSGQPTPDKIMELGFGYWGSKALLSAVELGVFTELAKGPLDADPLRQRLGLHSRSACDFFDALVALGMLNRDQGAYSNTPETDVFLDKAKPSYLGGILEMHNDRLYGFWSSLTEGLRTGKPQNEAKTGGSFFEVLYQDEARLRGFLQAMTGLSGGVGAAMAREFPWQKHKTFIDIGGAQGGLTVLIAQAHPHLSGGNFDLPMVGPIFEEYVASFGLSDRLKFQAGDFFADPLPKADVLIMGHILHDWNLDEKRALLAKAYEALPSGGALIVYEAIIDDERKTNAFGLLMSLNMLIELEGGFDYSGADCIGWMRDAGFRDPYVTHLAGPDSMVVGIK